MFTSHQLLISGSLFSLVFEKSPQKSGDIIVSLKKKKKASVSPIILMHTTLINSISYSFGLP